MPVHAQPGSSRLPPPPSERPCPDRGARVRHGGRAGIAPLEREEQRWEQDGHGRHPGSPACGPVAHGSPVTNSWHSSADRAEIHGPLIVHSNVGRRIGLAVVPHEGPPRPVPPLRSERPRGRGTGAKDRARRTPCLPGRGLRWRYSFTSSTRRLALPPFRRVVRGSRPGVAEALGLEAAAPRSCTPSRGTP